MGRQRGVTRVRLACQCEEPEQVVVQLPLVFLCEPPGWIVRCDALDVDEDDARPWPP